MQVARWWVTLALCAMSLSSITGCAYRRQSQDIERELIVSGYGKLDSYYQVGPASDGMFENGQGVAVIRLVPGEKYKDAAVARAVLEARKGRWAARYPWRKVAEVRVVQGFV